MAPQSLRKDDHANRLTIDEARAFVRHVESLFMPWNLDALADGFTEDCIVRFGNLPEFRGRAAVRTFFAARSARQRNYHLVKEFRSLMGDTITNVWNGTWDDAESGFAMKGFGVELWVMRDGRIAVWEAAFNVVRADQPISVADALR
jgi:nuclear transport factor 2 (NTF2) superfamily protein